MTDAGALTKILSTWVACPLLAGFIAAPLYRLTAVVLRRTKFHLLRLDAYTRLALVLAGAFGSYSLGANNIANVMGVFVPVSPFTGFSLGGLVTLSSVQQLFLLGAVAIGVGVFTYSKRGDADGGFGPAAAVAGGGVGGGDLALDRAVPVRLREPGAHAWRWRGCRRSRWYRCRARRRWSGR